MSNSGFIDFAALWPAKSGRGYRGGLDRRADAADVLQKLQDGWSLLMFEEQNEPGSNRPSHKLVLAPPRDQQPQQSRTVDERRDAPSRAVGRGDSRAATKFQGPAPDLDDMVPFSPCVAV